MDENKDLKTPETPENEGTVTEDSQVIDEVAEETAEAVTETAENTAESFDSFYGEINSDAEGIAEQPALAGEAQKTKKPLIQKTIIISFVIVIIAAIAAMAIKLFVNNDINGTWHLVREVQVMSENATSDEAKSSLNVDYYFTFKNDGTVTSTIGTVSGSGTYKMSKNDEGKNVVTVNIYDTLTQYFLDGEYTVELSGNVFTGKKMRFSKPGAEDQTYEFESASYKAPEIERKEDFEKNDDVTGKWVYSTGEFKLAYEFKEDGTARYTEQAMSINPYTYTPINIDITMDGIYTVKDETLTITYFFLEQSDRDITVRRDGDVLYINDYPFTKEGAATVDQAPAVQAQQQQQQQQSQQ